MNRATYTLLLRALSPALLGWLSWRARRSGGRWAIFSAERFGRRRTPSPLQRPIWVHAASLGETRAAAPLVQRLLDEGHHILLTHMTATGRQAGAERFALAIEGGQLAQAWLPYDFPGAAHRFLADWQPAAGVLIERELWPNLLAAARTRGVPIMLASARLSDRSLQRGLRAGQVLREAYAGLAAVHAQSTADASRLMAAGSPAPVVSGNLKFDAPEPVEQWRSGHEFAATLGRPVIVVASTREQEDSAFAAAWLEQVRLWRKEAADDGTRHTPLLCVVPRHPGHFDEAACRLAAAGLPFLRRTALKSWGARGAASVRRRPDAAVLLGDSLGEMPQYYAASQVAIVAGSFAPLGGQNIIEACAAGLPVIVGPHVHHFQQAVDDARAAGALAQVADPPAALALALRWLDDPALRQRMGDAGRQWARSQTGASQRIAAALASLTQPGST